MAAKGVNIFASTAVYAVPSFLALLMLHVCLVSPFFVWKKERQSRLKAEAFVYHPPIDIKQSYLF
jgi:uncharacterized Tic20 family protein